MTVTYFTPRSDAARDDVGTITDRRRNSWYPPRRDMRRWWRWTRWTCRFCCYEIEYRPSGKSDWSRTPPTDRGRDDTEGRVTLLCDWILVARSSKQRHRRKVPCSEVLGFCGFCGSSNTCTVRQQTERCSKLRDAPAVSQRVCIQLYLSSGC